MDLKRLNDLAPSYQFIIGVAVGLAVAVIVMIVAARPSHAADDINSSLVSPAGQTSSQWFSPLTAKDYAYMAAITAFKTTDWMQTRQIAEQPLQYHEINPILGRHPSTGRVNTYFALSEASYLFTAKAMPASWRPYFFVGMAAIESACVVNNAKLGLGLGLRW
jgi:hypothetical protein